MPSITSILSAARDKNLHLWLPAYLTGHIRQGLSRRKNGLRHVLFAFCDHFEPRWRNPTVERANRRVSDWRTRYPILARDFMDADGYHPRHSFFFPGEEYHGDHLDLLADLTRQGLGEVELHLHHDGDTRSTLADKITMYLQQFSTHGHLSRDGERIRYAFIHGNWCLANARTDRRWCGVDDELQVLHETGCYADFTFPAAPNESQPRMVNQIYWPTGDLTQPRGFDRGAPARVGAWRNDRILIIQGPLAIAPSTTRRRLLRIENANITAQDPPLSGRIRTWIGQNIHIAGRPDWLFVKVHTHGAQEAQAEALLGTAARRLHDTLTTTYNDGKHFRLHYVTAREMYNIACAACDGKSGDPGAYRNYRLPPPPCAT